MKETHHGFLSRSISARRQRSLLCRLRTKKKGILQSFVIKEPLKIDYDNATVDEVVEMIEYAIEQHPSFLKVIPSEILDEQAKLDKDRMWKY